MKKNLLFAFCALLACETFAQKLYIGNTFSFGGTRTSVTDTDDDDKSVTAKSGNFSFALNPEFGVFVSDKLSVGFQVGASVSVSKPQALESNYGDIKERTRTFLFGPTANYYVGLTEKLFWSPRAEIDFLLMKETDIYKDAEDWDKYFGFGFGIDLAKFEYRATDRLYINAGLGIGSISFVHAKATKWQEEDGGKTYKGDYDDNSTNTFSWGINNTITSISLGFKYVL